jgi:hypothetical protein
MHPRRLKSNCLIAHEAYAISIMAIKEIAKLEARRSKNAAFILESFCFAELLSRH